ncbi:MAG TPA: outer membrane protein assembly factor BamA [Gemmatimonadota bacterium]|nr:outer membrane protein assembly factor BamA [Gemmatimonadota bacterium]
MKRPESRPRAWAVAAMLLAVTPAVAQQPAPRISSIVVEGTRTLDAERVRALSGLSPGSTLTARAVQEAIRALWATNLFNDITVTTQSGTDAHEQVVVVIRVAEAPVITRLDFEGADEIDREDLEAALAIRPGDRLLEHRLHQAEIDLETLYEERGYYLAEVQLVATPHSAGGPAASDSTAVTVRIDEGRKVAIKEIEFDGNTAFSGARLRKALETDTEGFWFWQDGEFDEAKWRADLGQRLPAFYGSRGYLDMRVVSDSIAVDPDRGAMRLYVTVDEGRQYRIGDITIEGNRRFSRTDLSQFLRLEPGAVFDTQVVESTQTDLGNLYADDGYIYAQIQPVRRVRGDSAVVDLTWQIREGEPAHIRHVAIRGNTVTHESVIRRQLFVEPGERFRRTDVRNSLLSLEGLGFFEPGIMPTTRMVDEESGDIDLIFEVEERRTGSLTLGAAVGGGTGLSGFVSYEQPNLFGQARSGRIRWEFGSRNNDLELSYSEPVFLGSTTSASVSFFDIDRRFINQSFRQDAIGANVRFGTPLPWDDASRFFYGYKWQRIDLESTGGGEDRFEGEYPRTESSLNLALVRDTRLPRRHPIQGARHNLSVDLAGGPLQGNVGFHKYLFDTAWFAATFNDRTVLNLSLKTGGIRATRFVPLTEQFVLGGVQFPSQGLRGYDEGCVGVFNVGAGRPGIGCGEDRGNAFLLLTAEHFFKISDTIYASVFYDAGDVFREFGDVTFADLKRGAGVGFSIDLPGLGPLGLDLGYGFDRIDNAGNLDPGWQVHFRFGNLAR